MIPDWFKNFKIRNRHERSFGPLNESEKTTIQRVAIYPALAFDDNGDVIDDPNAVPSETAVSAATDVRKVGGDDVPTLGTQKAVPTAIYDDEGNQISSLGTPYLNAEFKSPDDFTVTFLSSTQIAVTNVNGFAITDSSQLRYIAVVHADGTAESFVNGENGITLEASNITSSGCLITITGDTPFVTGDVYEVGINSQKKAYDPNTQSNKVSVMNAGIFAPSDTETQDIVTDGAATPEVLEWTLDNVHRNKSIQIVAGANTASVDVYMTMNPDAVKTDLTTGWISLATEFGAITAGNTSMYTLKDEMPDRIVVVATDDTAGAATVQVSLKQF